MYRNARAMQRAFEDRQTEVLRTVANCGHLAPAVFAARERLEANLNRQALLRDGGPAPLPRPGRFRLWCGAQAIRLGAWIGGEGLALGRALPPAPTTESRLS